MGQCIVTLVPVYVWTTFMLGPSLLRQLRFPLLLLHVVYIWTTSQCSSQLCSILWKPLRSEYSLLFRLWAPSCEHLLELHYLQNYTTHKLCQLLKGAHHQFFLMKTNSMEQTGQYEVNSFILLLKWKASLDAWIEPSSVRVVNNGLDFIIFSFWFYFLSLILFCFIWSLFSCSLFWT